MKGSLDTLQRIIIKSKQIEKVKVTCISRSGEVKESEFVLVNSMERYEPPLAICALDSTHGIKGC